MSSRRRVLMICYLYPPILSSGVTRSLEFSRHLASFGWEPKVLTVGEPRDGWNPQRAGGPPDHVQVARTLELPLHSVVEFLHGATSRLARLLGRELEVNYYREALCMPDSQVAWCSSLRAVQLARDADAIYVSCSPFSSIISGAIAKYVTCKPLIIDFRDAWSLNPHDGHTGLHRAAARRLERMALRVCDRLILNTPGTERLYREHYPEFAHKMTTVPNGYDELMPAQPNDEGPFRIIHVGHFYGSRQPDLLLEALSELGHLDIEFVQLGQPFPSQHRFADSVRMSLLPPMSREAALRVMQTASLLYLKQGDDSASYAYTPVAAKTYEYLATGIPVLAECPPGDNADLVARYSVGGHVITAPTRESLKAAVLAAYERRRSYRPIVDPEFAAAFDRRTLTGQLARVLSDAVEGRH